ncbi:response regulator [Tautonia marina]|uniref:response regulator n=1 Tax=Tautonia marina TaxID=2653855 RepID=UPI0012604105|nr:response regulator [Tautonia marina]
MALDPDASTLEALQAALDAANQRADQAEQALEALYSGAADAIIIPGGGTPQVFIRDGADRSYREILELMAQGVAVCDLQGRILRANQALLDLLGEPTDRLLGQRLTDFLEIDSVSDLDALIASARGGTDQAEQGNLRLKQRGRPPLPVHLGVSRLTVDDLDVIVVTMTDMSRHQRDEELLASERLARSIIDQAVDAIIVCDPAGLVLRASREAHRLCGGNPLRQRFDEAFPLQQAAPGDVGVSPAEGTDPAHGLPLSINEIFGDVPIRNLEVTLRCGDSPSVLLLNSGPIRDEVGRRLATIVTLTDVTPLKQAEARLLDADRRKDEFLAMLAHELRNPLAAMAYGVALLHNSARQEPRDEDDVLPILERQVAHMRWLVDDLLDVARVERGRIVLRSRSIDLAQVAEQAVRVVQPSISELQHRLELTISPRPLWVQADPIRLEQVLVNLLTNAAKYTPSGGRIVLNGRPDPEHPGQVRIDVIDNGVGLDAEMRERVFDLFAQADRSLDRQQGGLGIGLTLVRRLVELHSGTVEVASEGPGQGSTFTVRLPAAEAPEPVESAPLPIDADQNQQRHVLLVEDNRDMARALQRLLEDHGHRVDTAYDGPSGLESAERLEPEVVVLDIGLPGLDGFELARRLRKLPSLAETRLIALSGYGERRDRDRAMAAGIDHHLTKPIDVADLDRLIRVAPSSRSGAATEHRSRPEFSPPSQSSGGSPALRAIAEEPDLTPPPSYRILLVEDQRALAVVAKRVLERIGHVVELAADGPTALELARSFRPDLVLCDLHLDGPMDGHEIARTLRADPDLADIPLIAVTARDGETIRRRSLDSGFDLHLVKPVDYTEVHRYVAEARRP